VGRLDPVKNQFALLEAVAALRQSLPGLRLTVVGDGPLRSALETQADRLGVREGVTFTGARSDTPDLMRAFDIFVLPSLNEGISNTILEAMATGLPVVATRVGGNPELVADGVTGRLYDPGVPGALEAALMPYVTDPALRDAHGRAARERVVQNFSLDAMVNRYVALYDELLADRRR
jgi:glycosyltransferase involved in cell wall biosynthesis